MNRISKSILVLATAGLLGSGVALAGNGPGNGDCDGSGNCDGSGVGNGQPDRPAMHRRGGPAQRMAGLVNRLGLSMEQQIQVLEMFELQAADRAEMKARVFAEFGDEMCAQRDQHREEFRAVLTDEQRAVHDEMLQKRDQRGSRQGKGPDRLECPGDN
ncbi:MAG: hypothetical protein HKO85_10390 [Xanthomonadales bacterium]|nr:hypothetical protein [Gammaproteobacteria bacterium]MBT8050920.1 hypothetical protein [Gammaproteobacteria bacterium]MBT8057306.1 hypothetical protein [Gammaproteobacteria bacterium]NNJ78670.1 hypothetical protein [Xanthomonadales bacterium]NNL05684.1 hypothetical protein [Xanthomonadales bacterium]